MWTKKFAGVDVDIGAAWVHGTVGSPLVPIAKAAGMDLESVVPGNMWLLPSLIEGCEWRMAGNVISEDIVHEGLALTDAMLSRMDEKVQADIDGIDEAGMSMGDVAAQILERAPFKDAAPHLKAMLRARLKLMEYWHGVRIDELSPFELRGAGDIPPNRWTHGLFDFIGPHCQPRKGMQGFVASLSGDARIRQEPMGASPESPHGQCTVLHGRMVSSIDWSDGIARGMVRITASHGETFAADAVIVTLPQSVLQKGDVVFTPPVPPQRLRALRVLETAAYKKVYLEFAAGDIFWNPAAPFFVLCGSCDETGLQPEARLFTSGTTLVENLLHAKVHTCRLAFTLRCIFTHSFVLSFVKSTGCTSARDSLCGRTGRCAFGPFRRGHRSARHGGLAIWISWR